MFADRARLIISSGFAAVMLLMLAVIVIGYTQVEQSRRATEALVTSQNHKTSLIVAMYTAVLERSVGLLRMVNMADPFQRDEEFMRLNRHATRYAVNRQALAAMLQTTEDKTFYRQQKRLTSLVQPLEQRFVDLLAQDRLDDAKALLSGELVPAQKKVLDLLDRMLAHRKVEVDKAVARARTREDETLRLLMVLVAVAAGIGFAILRVVIRKVTRAESALFAKVTLESIGDAVVTTDADGRVTSMNPEARRLLGGVDEECCGRPITEVLPFGAGSGCNCSLGSEAENAHLQPFSGECALKTATGEELYIDVSVAPIVERKEARLGSVIVFRDITERKMMEQELRANEQRFSLIMRGTNDGIWDYDLASGELYISPRWKSMLGYAEDEFADSFHKWQRLIHPNDLGQLLDAWTECMSGESHSFAVEYRMKTKDGDWKWVECRGLALLDEDGNALRLAGSHTDISRRKNSERELYWNSTHDGLTGLVNRREFERCLEEELKITRRSTAEHALMYIDLDQFKVINDTCGHVAGDELLRQVSDLLSEKFRDSDTLARLGGDEFGVLLRGCPVSKALSVANSLR
ncbi:MAG TPA: PAS domain S-box protein, partial [Gammaproteobacteria bacterium]|nr:PAS domain S-box protein [Gammaproteobacteria bacterium]